MVKNFLQCGRPGFDPWVGKISWRREWQPTPVFLPAESHRQRSPWVRKESDTTEQLNAFIFPGNLVVDSTLPLQGAQVWSLVRKLKSHVPRGVAKKKKKKELVQVMPIKSNQTPRQGMGEGWRTLPPEGPLGPVQSLLSACVYLEVVIIASFCWKVYCWLTLCGKFCVQVLGI